MSSGLECQFIEPKPGKWYYILQDWSCPVSAWDWREYASCYGPFSDFDAASNHLWNNHSNPGGYGVYGHADYRSEEVLDKLIARARR